MKGARRHRRFQWPSLHIIPRNHLNLRHTALGTFGDDAVTLWDSMEHGAYIGFQIVMQSKGQNATGQESPVVLIRS